MRNLITISAAELSRLQRRINVILRKESRLGLLSLRQAKKELRDGEKRLREFANLLPQTVFEIDAEGNLTFENRQALKTLGYTSKDLEAGLNVMQILAPGDRAKAWADLQQVLKGEKPVVHEYTAVKKDGTSFPVRISATPIMRNNRIVGVRILLGDISEAVTLREEREKNQKMESIGILAGGIAHDFNNLLTAILGNITLAKMDLPPEVSAALRLEEAEKAIMRSKDLTRQLLSLSKEDSALRRPASLDDLIMESASFALSGSNVRCEFAIVTGLWPVEIIEGQVCQVIHNLVINAVQAMPKGGVIKIQCDNLSIGGNDSLPLEAGDYVRISVSDQGVGIPDALLPKIFEPYFTTKRKGSGLGLATSYTIVKKHGGHMTVASTLGNGTTFEVYLPATKNVRPSLEPVKAGTDGRRGKILLMDDDEMIREAAGEMLKHGGHEVDTASDGVEAIQLFQHARNTDRPYDVLIMDLTVPGGMGGEECVRKLIEIDPSAKVLLSTGYGNSPVMVDFHKHGFSGIIAKPYRLGELNRAVTEVLEL